MISIITAMSRNRVIGREGKLPWYLPSDMKRFKKLTLGNPVIMGRRTFESIDEKYRPLPGRANIIVSGQLQPTKGITIASSFEEAVALVADCRQAFIIGGESIFRQALALKVASRLYLTRVEVKCIGDTFFPLFENDGWTCIERLHTFQGEQDEYQMSFSTYQHA